MSALYAGMFFICYTIRMSQPQLETEIPPLADTFSLSQLPLLDVRDGDNIYRGGDQEWFAERWQRQAGCGPTNCSNILWYLAQTRPACAPLCPYDASEKSGFVSLMHDVWGYVTPGGMGVNSTAIFATGAERYARDKGVFLTADTFDISPLHGAARSYSDIFSFLSSALGSDLPVAFLNLSNGALRDLDSWHWVTVVALRENEAMIYDQGGARWIDLARWLASSVMGGGFVAPQPK